VRQVVIDNNSVDRFADDSSAYEFVLAAISRSGLEICVPGNDLGGSVFVSTARPGAPAWLIGGTPPALSPWPRRQTPAFSRAPRTSDDAEHPALVQEQHARVSERLSMSLEVSVLPLLRGLCSADDGSAPRQHPTSASGGRRGLR
jgi:hypothetical protein